MGLLDGDIKNVVHNAASGVFLDYKVIDPNEGSYNSDTQQFEGGGAPNTYNCKGITEDYSVHERQESNIQENDRKIILLAGSIPVQPKQGWEVEDNEGNGYEIVGPIKKDPAGATYIIQGRI